MLFGGGKHQIPHLMAQALTALLKFGQRSIGGARGIVVYASGVGECGSGRRVRVLSTYNFYECDGCDVPSDGDTQLIAISAPSAPMRMSSLADISQLH